MIEPVAKMYQHDETGRTMAIGSSTNFVEWEKANPRWLFVSALYAIPEGYALVRVEQVKDAERLEFICREGNELRWTLDGDLCQVFVDGEPVCGHGKFFDLPTQAIDAAMSWFRDDSKPAAAKGE